MAAPRKHTYRFSSFLLDEREHQLWKEGKVLPLRPKAFETLLCLVKHCRHLVRKDELMEALWPDVAVGESTLTHCVWEVREVLGDDPKHPQWIETVPKLGYKFLSDVEVAEVPFGRELRSRSPGTSRRKRWVLSGVLTLFLLPVSVGLDRSEDPPSDSPSGIPVVSLLSSRLGVEQFPDLSEDGKKVAFTWNGERQTNFDIYTKWAGSSSLHRVTDHPFLDLSPHWSPDGRYLAFVRWREGAESASIMQVELPGGADHGRSWLQLEWSPDGNRLFFQDRLDGYQFALFCLELQTLERNLFSSPPLGCLGDGSAAVSPDGRCLVFVRMKDSWTGDLYRLPLDQQLKPIGSASRLTFLDCLVSHPCWTPGGQSLFFSTGGYFEASLHRMKVKAGRIFEPWIGVGEGLAEPMVAGCNLAFTRVRSTKNVYLRSVIGDGNDTRVTHSSSRDYWARFSPDGAKLAFVSNRSGNTEVYTKRLTGEDLVQLTQLGGQILGPPSWSPDGKSLAFSFGDRGKSLLVVHVQSRCAKRLELAALPAESPSWSRDGKTLYLPALVDGRVETLRFGAERRTNRRFPLPGASQIAEGPDGSLIFVRDRCLMRKSQQSEETIIEGVDRILRTTESGTFLFSCTGQSREIRFLDWTTAEVRQVCSLPFQSPDDLDISPDGGLIIYSRAEPTESDLLLAERSDWDQDNGG